MKSLLLALAILMFPSLASAQVSIHFGWTAPPPVFEVSPGIQVVENSDEEIFFAGGHYWVERDGRWYWAGDHREHWVVAPARRIPLFIRNHHRGDFRHWRHQEHVRAEIRHDERGAEHREEHHEAREAEHHEEHHEGR